MPALKLQTHELFAQGLAKNLQPLEAARFAGFSPKGCDSQASRLKRAPHILARVQELCKEIARAGEAVLDEAKVAAMVPRPVPLQPWMAVALRERQYRLTVIQDIVDRLRMVIDERAAAGREDESAAPGAGTGMMVRRRRNLIVNKKRVIVEEYAVDGVVVTALLAALKQGAIEAGEWDEEHRAPTAETVDVSHLTVEQLYAEQRILRETREKLDRVHRGLPPVEQIEAAVGTVEQVEEEVSGAEVEGAVEIASDGLQDALDVGT
jgi:phage terminase small subunit